MGATFLLVINFAIGLAFAITFLALAWRSGVALSRWCAAGFLSASATVTAEALSPVIPSVRVTSTLSFSMLMLALTLISAGLMRHYRPGAHIGWLFAIALAASLFNTVVLVDQPRGYPLNAFGYQAPFALMTAIGAGAILMLSPRRPVDLVLATVLALSAVQFLAKAAIAVATKTGPGVKIYLSKLKSEGLDEEHGRRSIVIIDYAINLEHIGDIIEKGLREQVAKKIDNQLRFSEAGHAELRDFLAMTIDNLRIAQTIFVTRDFGLARQLMQLKVEVRRIEKESSERHLDRLRSGSAESLQTSSLHLDMLRDLKRVNAHIVSVAHPILEEGGLLGETRLIQSAG